MQNQSDQNPPKKLVDDVLDCKPNTGPDAAVNAGLGAFSGPGNTKQGSLNDCWVLSSILGFQVSEKGRAGLAKMITASPGGGYDVEFGALCRKIHVDKVFSDGAKESGGQSAISILEAAYYQATVTDRVMMKCTGGFAYSSQEMITSKPSEHHLVASIGDKVRDQLTDDFEKTNAQIAEGRSVVVGTMFDKRFKTDVMRNGSIEKSVWVTTMGLHQYVVTKAAKDGVWVMNPWGPGNHADQGGEIWVPRAQINHSFSDLAISAPIDAAFQGKDKDC